MRRGFDRLVNRSHWPGTERLLKHFRVLLYESVTRTLLGPFVTRDDPEVFQIFAFRRQVASISSSASAALQQHRRWSGRAG